MPALRRFAKTALAPVCAALALSALSGCDDPEQSMFAPMCPALDIPGPAADRFVYDGRGLDIGSLLTHAQIVALHGDCERGPVTNDHHATVRSRISLSLNVTRGPAQHGATVEIPYFVAVMRDGKIVDKKIFTDTFDLSADLNTQQIQTNLRIIDLPQGSNPQINPYTLEVGFQLSRDQLAYNRKHLSPVAFHGHTE